MTSLGGCERNSPKAKARPGPSERARASQRGLWPVGAAPKLIKPGRKYEEAVKTFAPYDRVKEEYPEARTAGRQLIAQGRNQTTGDPRKTYIYVSNRLEGNALETIAAMVEA